MHDFTYHRAASLADALARLEDHGSLPLGGGTDLLVLLGEGLARPASLVDLRPIEELGGLTWESEGGVRIGATTRIHHLASDERVRRDFPMLASACESVAAPALRHMGTLGGNLCQRPRCWYFRRAIPCFKNGGDSCPAASGENQYHAILGGGPCYIVHPSDPAVALTALGATVIIAGSGGTRELPIEEFFLLPAARLDGETALRAGEIVTGVSIPSGSRGGVQRYDKLMQRGSWDFAIASLAAARRTDGSVRLVLGAVAPTPWRVTSSVEEDVASGQLDEPDIETLAERALYDAVPLQHNGYKLRLAATLLRRAITELAA